MNQERLFRAHRLDKRNMVRKGRTYTEWRLIYDFGEVHEVLD